LKKREKEKFVKALSNIEKYYNHKAYGAM